MADDDVEAQLDAALRAAVGASRAEQSAAALRDCADTLGVFLARLVEVGFTKQQARDMALNYFLSSLEED